MVDDGGAIGREQGEGDVVDERTANYRAAKMRHWVPQ